MRSRISFATTLVSILALAACGNAPAASNDSQGSIARAPDDVGAHEDDAGTGSPAPSSAAAADAAASSPESDAQTAPAPVAEESVAESPDLAPPPPPPITPEDWMARTPGLGSKRLSDIAIPGTHDSGTYSLVSVYSRPLNDAYSSDAAGELAKIGQFAFVSEPWAKAQSLTLGQQLAAGARYLDLRPCAEANGTLRICHGMYGPLLSDLLQDVANFASAHPQEIILLSMEGFAGMDPPHHAALRALVQQKLGSKLLDYDAGEIKPTMTLDEIWQHYGKSIVVIYDKPSERAPAFMPYSETVDISQEAWERDAKKAALLAAYAARDSSKLLPLSGQATPDGKGKLIGYASVPGSAYPDSLEELAEATNPVVQKWILDEWSKKATNIIAVDFFEKSCLFQVTQILNGVSDVSLTGCNIGDTSWGSWAIGPYERGVGSVLQCPIGKELVRGLCYTPCRDGYAAPLAFPSVCTRTCPSDYRDDGLTCFRDAKIISSDHDSCPAYDVCGIALAKGCSSCPSGYANDGCTCRRDPKMITKSRYDRGTGTIPFSCPAGTERDGLLCYPVCKSGFDGVGPLCVPQQ